jgi:hypothetical protein
MPMPLTREREPSPFFPPRRLVVAAALCVVTQSGVQAQTLTFEFFDDQALRGTRLVLTAGQAPPCTIAFTGRNENAESACKLALPAGVSTLAISGELAWKDDRDRPRQSRAAQTLQVGDIGTVLAPLRDRSKPFGARVRAFLTAKTAFEARFPKLQGTVVEIDESKRASAADIRVAEQGLGYKLPTEYVSLLQDIGQLTIDDSSTEAVGVIGNTWSAMVDVWGTPQAELQRQTRPETRALFKTTSLLFTEVGDGLGGLLFMPANQTVCGGRAAYYYVHQDDINDVVLLRDNGACMDYTDAMLWVIQTQALTEYDDDAADVVLVDRSASVPLRLRLDIHRDDGTFRFSLTPVWHLWP